MSISTWRNLVLGCLNKLLLVFRCVRIAHYLWLICFCLLCKGLKEVALFLKQSEVIEVFSSTSRYLDDLLNIDNVYFDGLIGQICPSEIYLNKANSSETESPFFGCLEWKHYNKRDNFDLEIVTFSYLDGDGPHRAAYSVYISQVIRFDSVSSHFTDFNTQN